MKLQASSYSESEEVRDSWHSEENSQDWNNYSRKGKGAGITEVTGGDDCPVGLKATLFNGRLLHDFLNFFISIRAVGRLGGKRLEKLRVFVSQWFWPSVMRSK